MDLEKLTQLQTILQCKMIGLEQAIRYRKHYLFSCLEGRPDTGAKLNEAIDNLIQTLHEMKV